MKCFNKLFSIFLVLSSIALYGMEERNTSQEAEPKDETNIESNLLLPQVPLYNLRTIGLINVSQLINADKVDESSLNLPEEIKADLEVFKKINNCFNDLEKKSDVKFAEPILRIKKRVYKLAESNIKYAQLFLNVIDDLLDYYPYDDEEFINDNKEADQGFFGISSANSLDEPFRAMNLFLDILLNPENLHVTKKYHQFYLDRAANRECSLMEFFAKKATEYSLPNMLKVIVSLNLISPKFALELLKYALIHTYMHNNMLEILTSVIDETELKSLLNDKNGSLIFQAIALQNKNLEIFLSLLEKFGIDINEYINKKCGADMSLFDTVLKSTCTMKINAAAIFLLKDSYAISIINRLGVALNLDIIDLISLKMRLELWFHKKNPNVADDAYISHIIEVFNVLLNAQNKIRYLRAQNTIH